MDLRKLARSLIPMRWQRPAKDEPLSLVLLLREPHFWRKEELRSAAEEAWRISFAGGEGSVHCVAQKENVTLLKAGPHLLSFFNYGSPYVESPKENIDWLHLESQRRAWAEHQAYTGVDYLNKDKDVELGYCVLAKLVAEMLNENCTGIYIPRESSLIPNGGSLYGELQKIAGSRDPGVVPSS
jgi:hypothetical protein